MVEKKLKASDLLYQEKAMIDVTFYHLAGKLVKDLIEGKGTVNSLCLHDSIRQKKRMVALVSETFKYRTLLNQIMEAANLSSCYKNKKNPDRLPYHVVLVVLYEFLWGVVIASSSSSSKKTLSEMEAKNAFIQAFPSLSLHKTRIRAEWTKLSLKLAIRHPRETLSSELALLEDIPKYARVNTLKASSCQEVMALLEQEGFVDLTSFLTQQDKPLKWFKKDDLIPNLLLFPSKGISFYKHKFVKNGWLIFQDKASCLPAFVLSPPPGAVVLDACAAPGNKTSHLASLMNNQGVIYAIEKDSTRFDTMNQLLERAGASCVKPLNLDFLRIDPLSEPFQQVQYILLDPSCSGSGMLSRLDSFVKGTEEEEFKKGNTLCFGFAAFVYCYIDQRCIFRTRFAGTITEPFQFSISCLDACLQMYVHNRFFWLLLCQLMH